MLLFFYLGGFGVRERSRYAALAVLLMYVLDSLLTAPGVVRIVITALLISNLRATWIASNWKADSDAAILLPRLAETLGDKFADRLPQWLWPMVRIPYYIFAGVLLVGVVAAMLFAKVNPTCALRSRHDADVRKISVFFGVVQAVANHEFIGNLEAHIIALDGHLAAARLVEQSGDSQLAWLVGQEEPFQERQGESGVEDVFHQDDVLAFH